MNTWPLASLATQVGSSEGRTRITGPAMSLGESAETQLWSSGLSSGSGSVLRDLGVGASLSVVRVLRFFGLSPLNVRGLTIVVSCVRGIGELGGGWSLGGEFAGEESGLADDGVN